MDQFFPPRPATTPSIYAFASTHPDHEGLLKVGYTQRIAKDRIAEQFPAGTKTYKIEVDEPALRDDGTHFTDHNIHRHLRARGFVNTANEWFRCSVDDVKAAILAVRTRSENVQDRTQAFKMRPEQREAVEKTAAYFRDSEHTSGGGHTPHFLWNAKMRFGKTFASYQLAKEMGWKKVLVLTFKPAVQTAWREDLETHLDFEGWQFYSKDTPGSWTDLDDDKPLVCFGSFQDYLGRTKDGEIKKRNEWVHATNWDCVILDEYHYGAWRENAKGLFGADEAEEGEVEQEVTKLEQDFDTDTLPITTDAYLYLSGTPFRALASGEFIEEQIYNWTYSDEQRAKAEWDGAAGPNPYAALPRLVLLTYTLPDDIRQIAEDGEFNEFDLNEFFRAKPVDGLLDDAEFEHPDEVQKWLDLIRGGFRGTRVHDLKLGKDKPELPFSDATLLSVLTHTFWFMPNVASCYAMANLLRAKQNTFYHDYEVVVAAGTKAGIGAAALPPVEKAMGGKHGERPPTIPAGNVKASPSIPRHPAKHLRKRRRKRGISAFGAHFWALKVRF